MWLRHLEKTNRDLRLAHSLLELDGNRKPSPPVLMDGSARAAGKTECTYLASVCALHLYVAHSWSFIDFGIFILLFLGLCSLSVTVSFQNVSVSFIQTNLLIYSIKRTRMSSKVYIFKDRH